MKQITIPVTDKQHCFLSRVAKENRRTLSQLMYLMLEQGECLGYECIVSMSVKKADDEISQEDKDQLALNKQIKKDHPENPDEWEKKGFKYVCTSCDREMVSNLFESIGDLSMDTSPLNEG